MTNRNTIQHRLCNCIRLFRYETWNNKLVWEVVNGVNCFRFVHCEISLTLYSFKGEVEFFIEIIICDFSIRIVTTYSHLNLWNNLLNIISIKIKIFVLDEEEVLISYILSQEPGVENPTLLFCWIFWVYCWSFWNRNLADLRQSWLLPIIITCFVI